LIGVGVGIEQLDVALRRPDIVKARCDLQIGSVLLPVDPQLLGPFAPAWRLIASSYAVVHGGFG
jgi:hypothetical protein